MSPREQADRLFERIMTAHEAGDTAQVSFFLSMSIDAYGLLGGLDADARYHVGLLHSITGNNAGIMAQADSLLAENPAHLMGFMLRNSVHQALGETATASEDYAAFLEHYDAEMATSRPEYQAHQTSISTFLERARAARGKTGAG